MHAEELKKQLLERVKPTINEWIEDILLRLFTKAGGYTVTITDLPKFWTYEDFYTSMTSLGYDVNKDTEAFGFQIFYIVTIPQGN